MLAIGLGNPGDRYSDTRHNIGFRVVDDLAGRLNIRFRKPLFGLFRMAMVDRSGRRIALVKPFTWMNRSGEVLKAVLHRTGCSVEEMVVVFDTLDLPPGTVRLKRSGGDAGHKGLSSIIAHAGTTNFARIAIGIGRPLHKQAVPSYVLSPPSRPQADLMEEAIDRASTLLEGLIGNGNSG